MSLPGHRDIWLQIYCRGLDGVLILLLRFYPRSPQALLSPTFTIQRFNSLHFSQYQGRMFYFTQLTLPYWSLLQICPSLPHISSKSSCQILIGTGLLIGEWFDTVGDTITPPPHPNPHTFLVQWNDECRILVPLCVSEWAGWMGIGDAGGAGVREDSSLQN